MRQFLRQYRFELLVVAFPLCMVVLGCGKGEVAEADFAKVTAGMTESDVEAILGSGKEVARSEIEPVTKGFSVAPCDKWLTWGNVHKAVYIGFRNGRVQERLLSKYH